MRATRKKRYWERRREKKLKRVEKNIKNERERKKMKGVVNPEKIRGNGIAGRVRENSR